MLAVSGDFFGQPSLRSSPVSPPGGVHLEAPALTIRRLSEETINRIAAGEVVERPASVVKELLENAIDGGSSRVDVAVAGGGLALIRVTDNGRGISREGLTLAVERHCTSKLEAGLDAIATLGFRGEALASIGAAARLTVSSKAEGADHGWQVAVAGGRTSAPKPSSIAQGTQVEVSDLFVATPARLKFMKSEQAENTAIGEVVRQAAMAHPDIEFVLAGAGRTILQFHQVGSDGLVRLEQILGRDFRQNAVQVEAERDGIRLHGHAGLPTFNRANAARQFFFVNGRPVRDRQLAGALRAAYSDFVARGRHPVSALFVDIPNHLVDVNVHPAKAEVRFRDPGLVRGLIVGAVREALANAGYRTSASGGTALKNTLARAAEGSNGRAQHPVGRPVNGFAEAAQAALAELGASADIRPEALERTASEAADLPLGAAKAQLHENYIIAQTRDGLIVIDQHAAHERLVYERLKQAIHTGSVQTQILLTPEIVDIGEDDVARLVASSSELAAFGLVVEAFGPGAVAIREVPALLDGVDIKGLVEDLADEIAELGTASAVSDRIDKVAGTIACHGSVRSGRRLRPEEMNALLREMEAVPHSGQCIHGRPTYIELKLNDLERLFGRR